MRQNTDVLISRVWLFGVFKAFLTRYTTKALIACIHPNSRAYSRPSAKPSPFSRLPIELVCNIMTIAATKWESSAFALVLVSREIRQLITPILYRTVVLRICTKSACFYSTLQATNFAADAYVRNLLLTGDIFEPGLASKILQRCLRVERLILEVDGTWDTADGTWPAPWEISFTTPHHIGAWFVHPIMRNVTHLYLNHLLDQNGVDACRSLPRLTHLALRWSRYSENVENTPLLTLIAQLLGDMPSLEMLLLHSDAMSEDGSWKFFGPVWAGLAMIDDKRLYGWPSIGYYELLDRFRSGITIWDHARVNFKNWRDEVWQEWHTIVLEWGA